MFQKCVGCDTWEHGLGGGGLMVGLDDITSIFKHKFFYASITVSSQIFQQRHLMFAWFKHVLAQSILFLS